jgi:hypothetical protein
MVSQHYDIMYGEGGQNQIDRVQQRTSKLATLNLLTLVIIIIIVIIIFNVFINDMCSEVKYSIRLLILEDVKMYR